MINALNKYGEMSDEWYLKSAKSINKDKGDCSGANVTDNFKKDLIDKITEDIKNARKQEKENAIKQEKAQTSIGK